MCGIAGILNFKNAHSRQLNSVYSMTQSIRHRGPDDEGYFTLDENGKESTYFGNDTPVEWRSKNEKISKYVKDSLKTYSVLAMGHRRLSIQDLSMAAHQPMTYGEGNFTIVFNGEIYNFNEIKTELYGKGYKFTSHSDTEVILAAYAEWGENCLNRFNGDFAFALWDSKRNSLFCARDRIGIKPFYYVINDGRLIFGSDIKTIIASGLYEPNYDNLGLYLAMASGIAPRPITAFKSIKSLKQSHWMRVQLDGTVETKQYWKIPIGTQKNSMKENEAIELLDEKLTKAIELRLVADVTVDTFMSGGVDSTLISAIASKLHPSIRAFTLGEPDPLSELDEVDQAKATAQMHFMTHIVERIDPAKSLIDLPRWISNYEEPFHSLPANDLISKIVKNHSGKVVLSGLGGDELFGGYGYYKASHLPNLAKLNFLEKFYPMTYTKFDKIVSVMLTKTKDRIYSKLVTWEADKILNQLFVPEFLNDVNIPDILHELYAKDLEFTDTLEAISYMDIMHYIGNHHVHRLDQFTMAHSVEGRFPFLDHEFITAAMKVPSHLKVNRKSQKYILRKLAENYIHPSCLSMKKNGFNLPLSDWMVKELKDLVETSLEKLKKRDFIEPGSIDCFFKAYKDSTFSYSKIWHFVALELWFDKFLDKK